MRQLSPDDLNSEFDRNYEYYRQRMERSLVKRVYDRGRFDDICQDTFVKALTYYASHRDKLPQTEYHLGNVLGDMAVQVAIDDYRKNKKSKDQSLLSEIEDTQLLEMIVEGHENQICNLEEFKEAIVQLPSQQQEIVLAMLQGFKQKDIADKLGVSPSMVNEYVRLARVQLRPKIYPVTAAIKRAYALDADKENSRKLRHVFIRAMLKITRRIKREKLEVGRILDKRYIREQVPFMDDGQLVQVFFAYHNEFVDAIPAWAEAAERAKRIRESKAANPTIGATL